MPENTDPNKQSLIHDVTSSAYFSTLIIKIYKYEKTKLFSSSQE